MNKNQNVGFFSRLRWGPGSIILLVILIVASLIFALVYQRFHNEFALVLSILLAFIVLIIFVIKSTEIIVPVNPATAPLIGRTGIVIKKISPNNPGVVKIDNQLWSAYSDEFIKENEEVIVENVDKIYLKVKRKI